MRILVITNLYPSPLDPQKAPFNRYLVRRLGAEHCVAAIAPVLWTEERLARREGRPPISAERRGNWDGIPVEYPRYYYTPGCFRGLYGRFYRRAIRQAFWQAVESFRPDVVLGTWAYPDGWAVVDLARQAKLPVVLKVHGSDIRLLDKYPSRRRGTAVAVQRADRVVAVSQDLGRRVIELGASTERVHVIYNGVDPAVFGPGCMDEARKRLGLAPARSILLFVGNLIPVKGIDVLIEACDLLAQRQVDFELHVIGRGWMRSQLEHRCGDLRLNDRICFHGQIANDQLPDWYRSASLYVLPSRSEGVPNVLLEASACGTPFVATNVGGVPEVSHLGHGLLVEPDNPDQLAAAIEAALALPREGRVNEARVTRTHADSARELSAVLELAVRDRRALRSPKVRSLSWRQMARRGLAVLLPRRRLLVRGSWANNAICLTFDDGPHPEHTPRLLDILAEQQIKATFFLVGREVEKYPAIVRRIASEGHGVGSHSFSHPIRRELSWRQMADDVSRGRAAVEDVLGTAVDLYRPPHGKLSVADIWWICRAGLRLVLWNVDPRDYRAENSSELVKWCENWRPDSGDIVLLHDRFPHALGAIPKFVQTARNGGLKFVTVGELA